MDDLKCEGISRVYYRLIYYNQMDLSANNKIDERKINIVIT